MTINWEVVGNILGPILALFVGAWLDRVIEKRAQLISYYGHVAAFRYAPAGAAAINVHTHSVILRNAGRLAATNIRMHHATLPDFNIWPAIPHTVEHLPDGSIDIVIPILVAKEQLTISYLYQAPLTFGQINAGIKCDQGFATPIPVLLQRQFPAWVLVILRVLVVVGATTVVYLLWLLLRHWVLSN